MSKDVTELVLFLSGGGAVVSAVAALAWFWRGMPSSQDHSSLADFYERVVDLLLEERRVPGFIAWQAASAAMLLGSVVAALGWGSWWLGALNGALIGWVASWAYADFEVKKFITLKARARRS